MLGTTKKLLVLGLAIGSLFCGMAASAASIGTQYTLSDYNETPLNYHDDATGEDWVTISTFDKGGITTADCVISEASFSYTHAYDAAVHRITTEWHSKNTTRPFVETDWDSANYAKTEIIGVYGQATTKTLHKYERDAYGSAPALSITVTGTK